MALHWAIYSEKLTNMSLIEDQQAARAVISHTNNITFHTGNIIDWFLMKKYKNSSISPDELMDGLKCVIKSWTKNISKSTLDIDSLAASLELSNQKLVKEIDPTLRDEMKISIKLFLNEYKPKIVRDAINKITRSLDVDRLDSVLLSFPLPNNKKVTQERILTPNERFEHIKEVWKVLEEIVMEGKVNQIGVCDFDMTEIEDLYEFAQIKPSVNQINLKNCCSVPNELLQYSSDKNIELLTHNDPDEILPSESLQNLIAEKTQDLKAHEWKPSYIARYAVLVKQRGIVHSKGYIVSADRQKNLQTFNDFAFF